ncbi:hypothetical protein [Nonomuraea sp. SYSU D8015]|uniref:hypothetical protein n=1 Tax=Nonomuraea sp. SYSU D8015 TaxID=2593644 RepID=UPI0016606D2D|nr:hypothetical protein [Nonomuraea sp. SYSU D8015]
MRLIVVALNGIEITIIALASAASAASHPEVRPAASIMDESGIDHGSTPADDFMKSFAEAMRADARELERLLMAEARLEAAADRSLHAHAWPREDMRAPQERQEGSLATAKTQEQVKTAQQPSQARPADPEDSKAGIQAEIGDRPLKNRAAVKAMRSTTLTGAVRMPDARHKRASVDLTRVVPRQAAVRVSHATANDWLKSAGLRTRSTGNCTSKHMHHCTSLDEVRTGTIARVIDLKRESRCPIMVTGGTEAGHAPGHFSHGNGYKLDISHNPCIDRYITRNHDRVGIRSDGAPLYRSGSGTIFADESDHWDILFR